MCICLNLFVILPAAEETNHVVIVVAWQRFRLERGIKRRAIVKYGMGGLLLFLLIFVIWFPLVLFSLSATIFIPDPPIDVTVNVKFWGFQVLVRQHCR